MTRTSINDASPSEWDSVFRGGNVNDNPPAHYDKSIQPWQYMESVMSEEAFKGYLVGNIIKYVSRFEDKGGREDLLKAEHYLTKLLSVY